MQQQQENAQKNVQAEHAIREQVSRGSDSASEIRVQQQMQNASTQVERMLNSSGTQTDQEPEYMDTSGGKPPPPPPGAGGLRGGGGGGGAVGAGGSWDPNTGWKPNNSDPLWDWWNSDDNKKPPGPPPPPAAAIPIHVPQPVIFHNDPQLIHQLSLQNALMENQLTKTTKE